MDLKAKNSITDRVQFTGKLSMSDQDWVRGGYEAEQDRAQSEGSEPARSATSQQAPVQYMGPERRQRRDRQDFARSA
jgi:hypothetical protein